MSNADNTERGRIFQLLAREKLEEEYHQHFELEQSIMIGNPKVSHKFDLVNNDRSIVVECKNYKWTDAGNVPSAKLMGLDEAAFYFSFLPEGITKLLCMSESRHPSKKESLAEYYVRVHGHLLRDVKVLEISREKGIKIVR